MAIAGALTLGASPPAVLSADHTAPGAGAPLRPFAAVPVVHSYGSASTSGARPHRRRHKLPPASAPIRRLPANLRVSAKDVPRVVLAAYVNAARLADQRYAGCELRWQVVAGIGYIESDNARSGGSYEPHWDGVARPPILGPLLDGSDGFAAIADTDGGRLDGNRTWDRAVGPMQFIPSTWARYAADGNHDGVRDPEQIDDATLAAADYLCAAGGDLSKPASLDSAVMSYNHSKAYVRAVLTVAARYLGVSPRSLGVVPGKLGVPKEHRRSRPDRRTSAGPDRTATPSPAPSSTRSAGATNSPTPSPSPPPGTPTASASPTPSQGGTASPSPSGSPSADPVSSSPGPAGSATP